MLPHDVKERIEIGIGDCHCLVNEFSGGQDHYSVVVVSDAFVGKPLLSRHRMIMDLFQAEIETGEVHALTIQAWTVQQWQSQPGRGVSHERRLEGKNS